MIADATAGMILWVKLAPYTKKKPHSYQMNEKMFSLFIPKPAHMLIKFKTHLSVCSYLFHTRTFFKNHQAVCRAEFPSVCKVFHIELQLMEWPGIAKQKCLAAICGCLKGS